MDLSELLRTICLTLLFDSSAERVLGLLVATRIGSWLWTEAEQLALLEGGLTLQVVLDQPLLMQIGLTLEPGIFCSQPLCFIPELVVGFLHGGLELLLGDELVLNWVQLEALDLLLLHHEGVGHRLLLVFFEGVRVPFEVSQSNRPHFVQRLTFLALLRLQRHWGHDLHGLVLVAHVQHLIDRVLDLGDEEALVDAVRV